MRWRSPRSTKSGASNESTIGEPAVRRDL
jgi:hypothetical protein